MGGDYIKMYKLLPAYKDYVWGGNKLKEMYGMRNGDRLAESWALSVHPDGSSMYLASFADYVKDNPKSVDKHGSTFPVLIKYIDAKQNLSVQVHPSDEYARRVDGDNGKTEMWYIIQADDGAGIYCGFKRDTTKEEFQQKLREGTVEELLNFIPVQAGDCYLIPAGTVHAICAGCVICEVQQSSNVTYRVYDYNRKGADGKPRPLHIEKALEVIDFHKFEDKTNGGDYKEIQGNKLRLLTACKYFRCRELILNGAYEEVNAESFTAINIIDGKGTANGQPFCAGDSFFVPCGESFVLGGKAKIILTAENNEWNIMQG